MSDQDAVTLQKISIWQIVTCRARGGTHLNVVCTKKYIFKILDLPGFVRSRQYSPFKPYVVHLTYIDLVISIVKLF